MDIRLHVSLVQSIGHDQVLENRETLMDRSLRAKSTSFCVVSEARTALWLLQASLALSYESFAVRNFRHEFPTRCQLSPHTFSGTENTDEDVDHPFIFYNYT
ncbi:hypothetical protein EYF80_013104 [Liparis tanakae]|uniref:Uncharacterized protein n=1 Tax=Liparis tanakae TaxID=230148 RepID=A0A4Z2IH41_9TELE|nr:hypothetical protein EYF80_013104 [Liparis tanakae]